MNCYMETINWNGGQGNSKFKQMVSNDELFGNEGVRSFQLCPKMNSELRFKADRFNVDEPFINKNICIYIFQCQCCLIETNVEEEG